MREAVNLKGKRAIHGTTRVMGCKNYGNRLRYELTAAMAEARLAELNGARDGRPGFMSTTTRQIRNLLKTAIRMHRSGQLESAAKLYENVLSHDENNAEALHWLGLLHRQAGDLAAHLISRPWNFVRMLILYHLTLAEVYRAALREFAPGSRELSGGFVCGRLILKPCAPWEQR